MHRSRLGNIVIDCNTGDLLAEADSGARRWAIRCRRKSTATARSFSYRPRRERYR